MAQAKNPSGGGGRPKVGKVVTRTSGVRSYVAGPKVQKSVQHAAVPDKRAKWRGY